jgi:Tfp pilus assembly protein PilV
MRKSIALLRLTRTSGRRAHGIAEPCRDRTPRPAIDGASESGLTLIEVIVSALLVGIIAVATVSGFVAAGHATTNERNRNQATLIAAQGQERVRGRALTKLTQFGTERYEVTETGLECTEHCPYAVDSSAQYVSAEYAEGGKKEDKLTCSTSEGEANFIKTTTVVHWHEATEPNAKEKTLEESSVVSVPASSALEVRVYNQAKLPVSGATVTAKGTTTNASQTTNSTGCVIFGSITDKTLELAATRPGFVAHDGEAVAETSATPSSKSLAGQELALAEPGAVEAKFATNGTTTAVTGENVYVGETAVGSPSYFLASALSGKPESSVTQKGLFPFGSEHKYTVFAGDCEKNNPETAASPSVKAASAPVEPNQTYSVTVEVPKLNLNVYRGTSTASLGTLTSTSAKLINSECAGKSSQDFTTVPYEHTVKVVNGLLETPYAPYAKSLELCVTFSEGSPLKYYKSKYTFANTAKAGTPTLNDYAKTTGQVTTVTSTTTC